MRLAIADVEPEAPSGQDPASSLEAPELYIYPPERESIELRFTAIRYDLEARGGRKPGLLKV